MKNYLLSILVGLLLVSCADQEKVCLENYVLNMYIPTYTSCDPLLQEYNVRYDTINKPVATDCLCEENRDKLEKSFWDIVDSQPENEQFMFYESPAIYQCVSNN